MTSEEVRALIARRDRGTAARDAAAVVAEYADDAVLESPSFGTVVGREAIQRVTNYWFTAFPDNTIENVDLVIEGNRAVQMTLVSGTHTGSLLGRAPTGRPYRFFSTFIFTLENNRIVHERRVYDVNGLLMQLAGDDDSVRDLGRSWDATLTRVRLEQEMKAAAEIQRALLPESRLEGRDFQIVAVCDPCRAIGGDFFDYFPLADGAVAFAVGDVSGKGPAAALLAAEIQGVLAAHSYTADAPINAVARVNRVLTRRPIESRFATLAYGVLGPGGRLTFCNAGHNPPVLVLRSACRRLEVGGRILGAFEDTTFEQEVVQLDPGDVLVVFSDGVTEALNARDEEFGDERLMACVRASRELTPSALLERLLGALRDFTQGAAQNDDRTLLVMQYVGAQHENR
jgi:predicted ester cyclase